MNPFLTSAQTDGELDKALIDAVENGNLSKVKELMIQGANPNSNLNNGSTILINSAAKGYIEIVQELINNGAKASSFDKTGNTALMIASENKHWEIVKLLREAEFNELGGVITHQKAQIIIENENNIKSPIPSKDGSVQWLSLNIVKDSKSKKTLVEVGKTSLDDFWNSDYKFSVVWISPRVSYDLSYDYKTFRSTVTGITCYNHIVGGFKDKDSVLIIIGKYTLENLPKSVQVSKILPDGILSVSSASDDMSKIVKRIRKSSVSRDNIDFINENLSDIFHLFKSTKEAIIWDPQNADWIGELGFKNNMLISIKGFQNYKSENRR